MTDFTEAEYDTLLALAAARYRFIGFDGLDEEPPVVLWRHDVDYSPQRALALARLEAARGIRATYFFNLRSDFYNVLELGPADAVRAILDLGHALGLHFDAAFADRTERSREEWLRREREILEDSFDVEVKAFSTHNPTLVEELETRDEVAGMVNAYGEELQQRFEYCSDSNGIWRHRPLREVLEAAPPRLHVLTHPGWWVPEALPPRDRISRAIEGRAAATHARYDRLLDESGRPNVRR
jgi:hypothetical protein